RIRYRGLIHEFATLDDDPNGLSGKVSPIGIVHHGYMKEIVHERSKGERNLEIVRAAAEQDPNEAYNWFNLGATAFLIGDYETSRDALEKMRSMLGGQMRGFLPNGLAVLAEVYTDKFNDPVKGEEVSHAALDASPHYANAHFQLGKALIAQKRFDEGRAAYEAAIDDGQYAHQQYVIDDQVYIWKSHSEIGSSYVLQGNDTDALVWFEKGLKNSPKAEPLHINRAKALERLGRIAEASEAYRGVYEMYRGDHATLEWVNFLLRQGRDIEAIAVIDESYQRMPADQAVPMLMAAAAVSQRRGSLDDERYLRAAAALVPGSAEVLDPLEARLRERGKLDDLPALIEAEEAVAPRAPLDYLRRGRRRFEAKDYAEALALARAGLALAPNEPRLLYAEAAALASLGEEEAALETIGRITDASAEIAGGALLMAATIQRNRGRSDEAVIWVDRVLKIDPNRIDALVMRSELMQSLGSDDESEAALKRAFEIERRQDVALRLSALYLKNGRIAEAAAIAEQALA
ncbi:MAG: tetratricopeptide repeat protein, partial [Candidatus Eremiobacteraeota bacterium]|nr:tetratricopeptide repeat protein [Candidatus Eremiobacteraeota bacterium]